MDLSLVVITRNEEKCLQRCVRSVPFASEVIVVDSGSTDSTVELAGILGCRVLHHDFAGYSEQKQWALEQAACSWVLSLDADEYLVPALAEEMRCVLSRNPSHIGFRLPFRMLYMGRLMRFGPWSGERHLRLFRKECAVYGSATVHEAPSLSGGSVGDLRRGYVVHESYDSLGEQVRKMMLYAGLWAEEQFQAGRGSGYFRIAFRPLWRFLSGYFLRGGFLEGVPGLAASGISAWYVLMKWLLLHERRLER